MSISASEKEEWAESEWDRSGSKGPSDLQEELIRVMNKAVQELELAWNPPEEPVKSKQDSWYFRSSRCQVDTRTSLPFFPDVHDQLIKGWSAPQSAQVQSATQAMFSQVDGAEAHAHALHRGDCRCTPVPCIGQNHGLGVQPTLQTMQDDSPSSQQGLLLGWGGCLRSTRDDGASSVPGQAPAVPGGWDRLTRSGERFACGHGLRADGNKARCPGDWPNHGVHGSLAEASRAYLSRPEGLRPQGAFKRTDQSLQPLWRCRGVNHRTVD